VFTSMQRRCHASVVIGDEIGRPFLGALASTVETTRRAEDVVS
jgi:hypothetical protein